MARLEKMDPFSAPIPGESLTAPKGGAKYEQPPQFTDPSEAAEFIFNSITQRKHSERLVAILTKGVPVENLVSTILFAGFTEGKWTPDVALLISRPVFYMIAAIGKRANIKELTLFAEDKEQNEFLEGLGFTNKADFDESNTDMETESPVGEIKGLMGNA